MTRTQAQLVRAIRDFKESNGYTPSVRELAAQTRRAPSTIMYHLDNMEREGLIRRSGRAFGIELGAVGLPRDNPPVPAHTEPDQPAPWTLCADCKTELRLPYTSYCRECRNARTRASRMKYSDLDAEQRKRALCRSKTKMLLRRGRIRKEPCEVCGDLRVQAHHDDYERPDLVRWLCAKDHREHHRALDASRGTVAA